MNDTSRVNADALVLLGGLPNAEGSTPSDTAPARQQVVL